MEYKLTVNATDDEVIEMLGKLIKLETIENIIKSSADDKTKVSVIEALMGGTNKDEL